MPRVVALDLGTHAVKATIWKSAGRKFILQDRVSQVVPQNGESLPSTATQLVALDALIDTYSEVSQAGNVVAAAWNAEKASLHRISLPFTDLAQVQKTLSFAVEDEVPFDLGEMIMGWRVLSQDVSTHLLVALAPRDELSGFIEEMNARSVEPRDVWVDSEALSCWSGDDTTALLDIGHGRTVVVVASKGEMHATRVVDVGGWHITRAIQTALECSWEEAEKVKHGELLADQGETERTDPGQGSTAYHQLPEAARKAVDSVMAQLMAEVRSSLIATEDRLGLEISQVRVGGGGSRFAPIAKLLERHLGVPVYCVVNQEQEQVDEPFLIADALAEQLCGRFTAERIDLRQGELAYRSGMNTLQALVTYGSLALAVFTLVAFGWYIWQRGVLNGQLDEINTAQQAIYEMSLPGEKVTRPSKAMELMGARIMEAEQRAAALGSDGEPRAVALIHDLTKAFPKPEEVTVDVLKLSLTTNVIQLDAETTGFAEVAKVEESLKANEKFSTASKSNEKKKRGKIEFTVQIPLDGTTEEEG